MKLALVLTASLIAAAATASAQDDPTVGVKAGISLSNLSPDEPGVETSNRIGLVAGLFGSIPVNSRVALQPEFLYAMKGAKFTDGADDPTLKIDYFEIPVLADVALNSGASRVSFVVGPSFAFRSRARIQVDGQSHDSTDQIKRADVGLVTGLAVTAGRFVLDGRYTWGLRDIGEDEREEAIRNRALSITAGWRFR